MGLFKVFGKLTDFYGNSMVDGVVCIKDAKMNDVYLTHTDKYGNYSFDVEAGDYVAITKDEILHQCMNLERPALLLTFSLQQEHLVE